MSYFAVIEKYSAWIDLKNVILKIWDCLELIAQRNELLFWDKCIYESPLNIELLLERRKVLASYCSQAIKKDIFYKSYIPNSQAMTL